jgi:predicted ATPase
VAACLGAAGDIALGLQTVDEAITRCETRDEGWYIAELLRIRGELLLLQGGADGVANTEQNFRRALDLARRHGALSWELRVATSLARLWRDRAAPPLRREFSSRFTTASPKGSRPPT